MGACWHHRQGLPISLLLISFITNSLLLLYHPHLLTHAQLAPPTNCQQQTRCSPKHWSISFPFVTDACNYNQSDFFIAHCEPNVTYPDWPGFSRHAITDAALDLSKVTDMVPQLNSCAHFENTTAQFHSDPCYGYVNLTWIPDLIIQNSNKCNSLSFLDPISLHIPASINLQKFAHSAFDFAPSNIILLYDCNVTRVKASPYANLLESNSSACQTYTRDCNHRGFNCYQYNIRSKELLLPEVTNSSECKQAMFFVSTKPSLPAWAWQPGLIQLNWTSRGTENWLNSTLQQCEQCLSTQGSCGYGPNDDFRCLCPNTGTNCSANMPTTAVSPTASTSTSTSMSAPTPSQSPIVETVHHKSNRVKILIGVATSLSTAILTSLALLVLFCFCKRKKDNTKATHLPCSAQYTWIKRPSFLSRKQDLFLAQEISYKELVFATNSFADTNILGDGGFGAVYRGVLANGLKVAVKRLHHDNYKRIDHFYNELKVLSNLYHPNLVKLFAFCACADEKELLLVFEYASQGTVSDHLHGGLKPQLSWSCRLNIACETAAALSYLHNAIKPPIYHRDVKTTNILLDENFHAKLADFGLSKLVPLKETHVSTAPQGTPGYLDPEYHECYQLTDKSDVYSLGVVLMELVSGKLAVDMSRERGEINLSTLAMVKIQCGLTEELVDPALRTKENPSVEKSIKRVIELAFACLQACRDDRPAMQAVAEALASIRRESQEAQGANGTPKDKHPRSPHSVLFSSDSSCPSSNLSSSSIS